MVEKSKSTSTRNKNIKIQGTTGLDFLVIIVVVITVFAFLALMILGPSDSSTTTADTTTTARSTTVSSSNTYPYTQPTTTFAQPTYANQATYSTQATYPQQNTIQGRAGFANSVAGDINNTANLSTSSLGATGLGTTGLAATAAQAAAQAQQMPQTQAQPQASGAYGISNGQVIGLNPIQPLTQPYIPTTATVAATPAITGRAAITPNSNPAMPYASGIAPNGTAVINIDTVQAYRPQNHEMIMEQACVQEVWQRNPFVISNFSNLSVRLSATNPTSNGNMRTYSFNLDNRPTGNGALCTVTMDGYVTAVSFY